MGILCSSYIIVNSLEYTIQVRYTCCGRFYFFGFLALMAYGPPITGLFDPCLEADNA